MQTSSGNVHAFSSSEKSKLTPFMSRYGAFLHIYYSLLGNIAWMIQAIEKPQEFKVQCTMTTILRGKTSSTWGVKKPRD
jgi:hypothetical protein